VQPRDPLAQFEAYCFTRDQVKALHSDFEPKLVGATFARSACLEDLLETHKRASGIYFWVLRHDEREYRIYVGKTKSLSNRLLNYMSGFQPHSPNDYKLRVFAGLLAELEPTATLNLYFSQKDPKVDLTAADNDAIHLFDPLLNQLPPATVEAKRELQEAFEAYYRDAFVRRLSR